MLWSSCEQKPLIPCSPGNNCISKGGTLFCFDRIAVRRGTFHLQPPCLQISVLLLKGCKYMELIEFLQQLAMEQEPLAIGLMLGVSSHLCPVAPLIGGESLQETRGNSDNSLQVAAAYSGDEPMWWH